MTPDDPAATALQRLEQAMDSANDLIGQLIRRLDDGATRPRLRVVNGAGDDTVDAEPVVRAAPRLRVLGADD